MVLKVLKLISMNKIFIITFFLLLSSFTNLLSAPNISAKTAILIDFNSGKVLYELDPDIKIYPASMT